MNRRTRAAARFASGVVLAAGLLAVGACSPSGPKLNPVTGKVLHNGQAAAGAIVTFHPETSAGLDTVTSTGVAGDDGTFTLSTGADKGAKEGKYVVTVMWPDPKKKPTDKAMTTGGGAFDAPDVFGGKYLSREKSKLKAEVKPGENKLEPFDLK
jgi:hypothetical protein